MWESTSKPGTLSLLADGWQGLSARDSAERLDPFGAAVRFAAAPGSARRCPLFRSPCYDGPSGGRLRNGGEPAHRRVFGTSRCDLLSAGLMRPRRDCFDHRRSCNGR